MTEPIVPSENLVKAMNRAELLLQAHHGDMIGVYWQINQIEKDLTPAEKRVLADYIAKRSAGVPIEQSLRMLHIFSEGIRAVEHGVGIAVDYVVVQPSKYAYNKSETVRTVTDWVVDQAHDTASWCKEHTPDFVANQWGKLMGVIQVSKKKYANFAQNTAQSFQEQFLVDRKLAETAFEEDIPFLSEQIVLVLGTKGVEKGASALLKATKEATQVVRTGAYTEAAAVGGRSDLGKLLGKKVTITQKGLETVENHIKRVHDMWGSAPENIMMLERLKGALHEGRYLTNADASFYLHEVREAQIIEKLMKRGLSFEQAQSAGHLAALNKYRVSSFSVYHPDVIQSFEKGTFHKHFTNFWGFDLQERTKALVTGKAPAFNFTSFADGTVYQRNRSLGKFGTYVTDRQYMEDILGPINLNSKVIEITPKQARTLAHNLGIDPERVQYGGTLTVIEDISKRRPRSPTPNAPQFKGRENSLPQGGPQLEIAPISNTPTDPTIKQIEVRIKNMSVDDQKAHSYRKRELIKSTKK